MVDRVVDLRPRCRVRYVGQYELVSKLGEGGMAEVWKGIRRTEVGNVKKTVAIKLIAGHSSKDLSYQRMFMREARVSMLLSHSTIAQVFDVGIEEDQLYMAMEFVNGMNLRELSQQLEGEPFDFHVIAYIVGEILRALAYAHEIEHEGQTVTVIHRDISPHNVMLSISGEVKVTDFGIASISAEETTGSTKGKLQYMPPEQLLGDSRMPTIDLFAVGAVLHELIESKPFRAAVDNARMYGMVLAGVIPVLSREGVPEALRTLHNQLLQHEPSQRPQSAQAALEQLYEWKEYRNASLALSNLVKRARAHAAQPSSRAPSASQLLVNVNDATLLPSQVQTIRGTALVPGGETESTLVGLEADIPTQLGTPLRGATAVSVEPSAGGTEVAIARRSTPGASEEAVGNSARGRLVAAGGAILIMAMLAGGVAFFVDHDRDVPAVQDSAANSPSGGSVTSDDKTALASKAAPSVPPLAPVDEATEPTVPSKQANEANDAGAAVSPGPVSLAEPPVAPKKSKKARADVPDSKSADPVEPSEPPAPKPAAIMSEVVLLANAYPFSYVKLDNKHYTLEPRGTAKLPPGSYVVHMRQSDDEDWQKAGTLVIEAGKNYKVLLQKPVGLVVQTNDGG